MSHERKRGSEASKRKSGERERNREHVEASWLIGLVYIMTRRFLQLREKEDESLLAELRYAVMRKPAGGTIGSHPSPLETCCIILMCACACVCALASSS